MRKITLLFSILLIGAISTSCSQGGGKKKDKNKKKDKEKTESAEAVESSGSAPYDFTKPQKFDMPTELLEISGVAFNNGDNSLIYAEQDEDGNIYSFKPGDKNPKVAKFGKHGDYEDVAIGNGYAVILRSDGEFRTFPLSEVASGNIQSQKIIKGLVPAGEYEGLHFDNLTQKLYVLCKQCAGQDHSKECGVYALNLAKDGGLTKYRDYSIDVTGISDAKKKKFKFHPSALARNPTTKEWYILSSVNKMVVVTDENWKIKTSYPLGKDFLQPEGMAFDKQGNLYISNEGDKATNGNILLFKHME